MVSDTFRFPQFQCSPVRVGSLEDMTDRVVDIEVVKKMGEQMVNVKEEMVENTVTKQNSSLLLDALASFGSI